MEIQDYDELYRPDGAYQHHVEDGGRIASGTLPRVQRAKRTALRLIERTRPGSLLEIGCGNGTFLAHVRRAGLENACGIDVSANALALARQHIAPECLYHGVLDECAFPDRRFDVICSWEVLEHVPDPVRWLVTIRQRLNPGGMLLLSTPNYESRWIWGDMPADPRSRPPVHLTFWSSGALEQALVRAGFASATVDCVSLPLNAAARSGGPGGRPLALLDAVLRPRQRATIFASARA